MTIRYEVLGQPDSDNALWVEVDSGQQILRFLLDCGDRCLTGISLGRIQQLDHVFFSHFHMDHISGFDALFRCVYARDEPIHFWGPENAAEILAHRFQGFWWNLVESQTGSAIVHSLASSQVTTSRFELAERFSIGHHICTQLFDEVIFDSEICTVRSIRLKHHGTSIGYRIDEKPKSNVSKEAMVALGLQPGPWLKELKEKTSGPIEIDGKTHSIEQLRARLISQTQGDSIAYLTDFLLDTDSRLRLIQFLEGCQSVVIEAQYGSEDVDLAMKNHHTTTDQVSQLAADAAIKQLVLFHLSDRYQWEQWQAMLREAREHFPETYFPDHWF